MADFPDLNDDGKVTRADILKGRGVFKRGGKVKKIRKFEEGGLAASAYGSGLLGSMKNSSNKKTSSFSEAHDKALRIGLEPGSEDYRLAMDSQMRNPAERSRNQALEKVKSTAMAAGKRLMDMTPQGVVAKGVTSMGKKYPRYSEGESSFEQEMGMKKGGKVSSASKRADGIATKGKTRGRMV